MSRNIKLLLFLILAIINIHCDNNSSDLNIDNSNNNWEVVSTPENLGYSSSKLEEVKQWAETNTETAAVMVIVDGKILYQWGNTSEKYLTHSFEYEQ